MSTRNRDKRISPDERVREMIVLSDGEVDRSFEIEATISLDGGTYLILIEVQRDGRKDDEGLVFSFEKNEEGKDIYRFIKDDDIIDSVFREYYRLLDLVEEEAE